MNSMPLYRIGVDMGGTKIETVILDEKGFESYRRRVSTPSKDGYDVILNTLVREIETAKEKLASRHNVTIGVCIPGSVNPDDGLIQNANTTCLNGMPFHHDVNMRLNHKVAMENDANCFALAEAVAGAARGYSLVFGVIMGTGCGGGISIDGRVRKGPHAMAGEWGHVSIDPEGAPCFCGKKGCIETKISGGGVEKAYERKFGAHLSMNAIVAGFRKGDPECADIFKTFLDDFGRSLGGLISILDPDAVVLGGGLSNIDELYTMGVENVRRYAFHQNLKTPILRNSLGDSAGVIGASWIGI